MPEAPRSLLLPFRRDQQRDLASGTDERLLAAKVTQALATEGTTPLSCGELPWRTAFGSALHLLRHLRNDAALADLARIYVRDCLERWVPDVELVEVNAARSDATLTLKVHFRAASTDASKEASADATAAVELTLTK
jgi:hypothetical protein